MLDHHRRLPAALRQLRSLQIDDARRLRRETVEALKTALGADDVMFLRFADTPRGPRVATLDGTNAQMVRRAAAELVDRPFRDLATTAGWSLQRPPRAFLNAFAWALEHSGNGTTLGATTPTRQLRALVYDDDALLGYIIASFPLPVCDPRLISALDEEIDTLRSVLSAAEAAERVRFRAAYPVQAVLFPDGTTACLSDGARGWLTAGDRERLAAVVRAFAAGDRRDDTHLMGVAEITLTHLDGAGGARVVATAREAEQVRLAPDHALSDRQREIARIAAVGATIGEIATSLDISPNTVKSHLKEVYRLLSVGSRVELRDVLEAVSA